VLAAKRIQVNGPTGPIASGAATINVDEIDGFLRDEFGFDKLYSQEEKFMRFIDQS
jgi:hypothetical protein